MHIRFKLDDLDQTESWGEPGACSLSWYGLSLGAYCIETDAGRLLQWSGTPHHADLWCTYQVVRLFEDILHAWPFIAEPVPRDVAERSLAWVARGDRHVPGDEGLDAVAIWWDALEWRYNRLIDFGYLVTQPALHVWRVGDDAHLDWCGSAEWTPPTARVVLPFEAMQGAVQSFIASFLGAMRDRVDEIARTGWQPPEATLDTPRLVAEQAQREEEARIALSSVAHTDWLAVRSMLDTLGV